MLEMDRKKNYSGLVQHCLGGKISLLGQCLQKFLSLNYHSTLPWSRDTRESTDDALPDRRDAG